MAQWKVTPEWKKSLYDRQFWEKDGKVITVETGWRWGDFYFTTEGDEPPVIEEGDDLFCVEGAELDDWSTDDGCWEDIEYSGFTEEEQTEMEEWIEENGTWALEDGGWNCTDGEMIVGCDVTIERVE